MKIAVIGGTGLIGSQVVTLLNEADHEAVPHSPSTGLNLLSGQGLPEALTGADVVVNLTNSPTFDEASLAFFRATMDNLLAAAEAAGVGHAVILSSRRRRVRRCHRQTPDPLRARARPRPQGTRRHPGRPDPHAEVDEQWVTVPAEVGEVAVRIVRPVRSAGPITRHGRSQDLNSSRLAIAGDSVGANMTAALTILAKQRGDVTFVHQSLHYPVTDAGQNTGSYREFADGPYLTAKAMAWFWDAYLPDEAKRGAIAASPLRATVEDFAGLPEAFVIVDENDVLRDEGEAHARKLTEAGDPRR